MFAGLSLSVVYQSFWWLLVIVVSGSPTVARPLSTQQQNEIVTETELDAWEYLKNYGYVQTPAETSFNKVLYRRGIRAFAQDVGHDQRSDQLMDLIRLPRCTRSSNNVPKRRRKRFMAHVTRWIKTDLRWKFRDPWQVFDNRTDFVIAKQTLAHALKLWSVASNDVLRFSDISDDNNATDHDIDIFFATGAHGDHEPFDGPGGIVAHSGYPMQGKIHFDASESWTINGDKGIDLRYVTLHETGHSLGLRHSKHKNAIMHPIYKRNVREIALSDDDIEGIRYLYPERAFDHADHIGLLRKMKKIDFEEY